ARGVLVEQPTDVGFAHRRGDVAAPEPGKLEPGAEIIRRVGVAGLFECRDSAGAVAKPVADGAEREPGGGESRRAFHGLREDIGGAGKIAARGKIEGPVVAPVSDEIAGGDEERSGIGHAVLASRREMVIYYWQCVLKTSWCRRRSVCAASSAASISTPPVRSSAR